MLLYNSITKKVESFLPIDKRRVTMYVCGLTPYDSAHIGHARAYVAFDLLKRYLAHNGFSVFHIQNITDVEDKIIKRCTETGADPKKLTTQMHDEALELFDLLAILRADVYPKVTDHIPEIIALIQRLLSKGHAYETPSGIYFDVSKFTDYGRLSGQNVEEIKSGSRKEVDETKEDPADFALWKKTKGEILEFDSPWGKGRPGWHIECSALALKYAGQTLDLHGGARDLIFPHHENEIAQSESANGKKFCKHWVHVGFLTVEGEKMSKSLGNFITLRQALSRFSPNALRMFYLQAHYRSPVDYDEDALDAAGESVERIFNSIGLIHEVDADKMSAEDQDFRQACNRLIEEFYSSLDNDLDTPRALASLFSLLRVTNSQLEKDEVDHIQLEKVEKELAKIIDLLGLIEQKKESGLLKLENMVAEIAQEFGIQKSTSEAMLDSLITLRVELRKKKDFSKSDAIRAKLLAIGIVLEDKETGGPRWKVVQ
jgi:cysteinyl-tRNA synthetase